MSAAIPRTGAQLERGLNYWVSPPKYSDEDPGVTITNAAELDQKLQAIDSTIRLQVARYYPLSGGSVAYECYPVGSTIFSPPHRFPPDGFCWSETNNLTWNPQEGIQIKLETTSGTGGPWSFTWSGCEDPHPPATTYDLALGRQLVAVPYNDVPPTARDLMLQIGGGVITPVQFVSRLNSATDTVNAYTGRMGSPSANYPLAAGEAYYVGMFTGHPPGQPPGWATLQGTLFGDITPNGVLDAGEPGKPQRWVKADWNGQYLNGVMADSSGNYTIYTPDGSITLSAPTWAGETFTPSHDSTPSPPFSYPIAVSSSEVVTGLNFGKTPVHDLGLYLFPKYAVSPSGRPFLTPCPTVGMKLCVHYTNLGDYTEPDASAELLLPPAAHATYNGAAPLPPATAPCSFPPNSISGPVSGLLTMDLSNIPPNGTCTVCADLTVDAPLNTVLDAFADVFLNGTSHTQDSVTGGPSSNTGGYAAGVICSYDPNDKGVDKGCGADGFVNQEETLTYTVHFQNLGNAPATDVVIRDVLDQNLDETTLEVIDTGHTLTNLTFGPNRILEFSFFGIDLPPAIQNDAASRGYIVVRHKARPALPEGTKITNKASIYFDLNPPVVTNTVVNTVTNRTLPPGGIPINETCNNVDDDCDGVVDDNLAAPAGTPELTVTLTEVQWTVVPDSSGYDVVRGDLVLLESSGGDFTSATTDCLGYSVTGTSVADADTPDLGEGFWYVARAENCDLNGTYDSLSASQVESRDAEIDASLPACP